MTRTGTTPSISSTTAARAPPRTSSRSPTGCGTRCGTPDWRSTTRSAPLRSVGRVCDLVDADIQTFELLRTMTIADARAVGPQAWIHCPDRIVAGTRAFVLPSAGSAATVIEVRSQDRQSLLRDLGSAPDPFYVTDGGGRALRPAAVARTLSVVIDAGDGDLRSGGPPGR